MLRTVTGGYISESHSLQLQVLGLVRVTSEIPILKDVQAISGLLSLKARSACKRFALATSMLLGFDPCGP